MIKAIGIIITAIFYFDFSGDIAHQVKKAAVIKVHKGLLSLTSFTEKMTFKKNH
jgi:hypothetical protein